MLIVKPNDKHIAYWFVRANKAVDIIESNSYTEQIVDNTDYIPLEDDVLPSKMMFFSGVIAEGTVRFTLDTDILFEDYCMALVKNDTEDRTIQLLEVLPEGDSGILEVFDIDKYIIKIDVLDLVYDDKLMYLRCSDLENTKVTPRKFFEAILKRDSVIDTYNKFEVLVHDTMDIEVGKYKDTTVDIRDFYIPNYKSCKFELPIEDSPFYIFGHTDFSIAVIADTEDKAREIFSTCFVDRTNQSGTNDQLNDIEIFKKYLEINNTGNKVNSLCEFIQNNGLALTFMGDHYFLKQVSDDWDSIIKIVKNEF